MTTLYKLTDEHGLTHGDTQWGPGVTHSGTGKGDLCGPGWIHAYTDPLLAVLLNPLHADFKNPLLWRAEGEVVKTDRGLKVGCRSLTTIEQIPLPVVTTEQRVRFAILCARAGCSNPDWIAWADAWMDGTDRSDDAAYAAGYADADAAAAYTAADAAHAAAYAAAAYTAADAAYVAAYAADIDLIGLAREACA